ncbi:CotH kinase family protein [Flavobacterium sp.]|uniref:CotH kinase family protein n=1 Tax=Flavobacterium sp. TaxID=239 RepID=UPI00286D0A55|nr:CotH kinase family protein [Flavobacterium sp.]
MKKTTPFFIALLLLFLSQTITSQSIVINEVLASNSNINQDEDGSYQDWVELRNNGATSVNLTDFGLTDDATMPFKWTFPNISIGAGQYLLVWCSDKDRATAGQPLHTNFKLSSAGETLTLTNALGVTLNTVTTPAMLQNISYGRIPNGTGAFMFFNVVTPEAANGSVAYTEALSPPTFSQDSGILTSGFNLTLSTTVPGATILYTLDGSEPQFSNLGGTTYSYKNQYRQLNASQTSGPLLTNNFRTYQYSAPLAIADRSPLPNKIASISTTFSFNPTYIPADPIFKGTVVRAKLIKAGALDSQTETRTYYISPLGANRFTLPVLSLNIDENKLFDYNDGISVAGVDFEDWRTANPTTDPTYEEGNANYYRSGRDNERTANMTYLVNGVEVLNQDIGIRIHGGISRSTRSKSYNLYARPEYGKDKMHYNFFSNLTENSFDNLVLRNSGGDFIHTMFRDALCNRLVRSLNCLTESYQPTVTFINGEYNGILNLNERYDDKYFARTLNIAATDLDYLVDQGDSSNGQADYGDDVHYQAMLAYLNANSMATPANYNYIKTQLDPDSFSDYHITNIYLQNVDWPGTNIEYWRKRTAAYTPNAPYGHDGRWRWAFHDFDDTFALPTDDIALNTLALATEPNGPDYPNPAWSTFILRKLLVSPTYKNDFINRFADLMNTTFLPSRVVGMIDSMKSVIEPEMLEHINRWKMPVEIDNWQFYLNQERDFANQRPAFQRDHIRSQFGIASNINATLDVSNVNAGYIKINTIDIKVGTPSIDTNPYPWTGVYFSNIPVTIKAIANPGYVFSHWTGISSSTNAQITINSGSSFNLTAVFVLDTVATPQPIYFWMMNSAIANNVPLETLNTTYKSGTVDGAIQYQSCLVGYPFVSSDVNWRKASMERRNSPTAINYIQIVNNDLPFATSDMKGLQIKEPLANGSLENTMVFNFSTVNEKDIKFSFAAINELTNATGILVDYSVNAGTPVWLTTGLAASTLPLTNAYQLFNIDFTAITSANNNANFKVRLRFTGTNMTADTGARITFNNIAVYGTEIVLAVEENFSLQYAVYPNPVSDVINVVGINTGRIVNYKLYTIDGKQIKAGTVENAQINLSDLSNGLYLLQLESEGRIETKKISKK